MFKKKIGFTLAEILITLGIIGVVAALAIPTINSNLRKKKLAVQFKKTYADLNNAAQSFYQTEGYSVHDANEYLYKDNKSSSVNEKTIDLFLSHFNGHARTTSDRWKSYDVQNNITQKNLNGTALTAQYPCDMTSVHLDMTGRLYAFDDNISRYGIDYGPKICVDINGNANPNRLGYDRFVFVFTNNNTVVPYTGTSWNDTNENVTDENIIKNYCSNSTTTPAHSCAYFALKDKSPDGNGSYWKDFLK